MSTRIVLASACLAWVLAIEGLSAARAQGVTGMANTTSAHGLSLTVDSRWPGGHGYRPVRIEVSSLAPSSADRTLTIELKCTSLYSGTGQMTVGQDIEVPAGVSKVVETIAVPEQFAVGAISMETALDGRYRKGLSITNLGGWSFWGQGWEEMLPSVLFVPPALPDTNRWVQLFPESTQVRSQNPVPQTAAFVSGEQYAAALATPADQLPQRFVDYSSLDIVVLPLEQALGLAASQPEAWTALRRWTAAGGNLWIYGAGDNWERLAELERTVGFPPPREDTPDPVARGWTAPRKEEWSDTVLGRPNSSGMYQSQFGVTTAVAPAVQADESPKEPGAPIAARPTAPDKPHFVSRRLAAGLVVAIGPENPFPGTAFEWGWVFNHVGSDRILWAKRHGLSQRSENVGFWDWMIPGVGLAPVGAFRALITVFVLFIGPVNYFWLRRRGKLHLLLLSIPLCALLVTGSLFGYGIIADGLGVQIRMRSFTEIDQRRGEAICWSRNSYYASLAPSGGLLMPEDVVVLPLEAVPHYQDNRNQTRRSLDWTAEGQKLHSGWLSARTLTQYLLVRSRASERGLKLDNSPAGDSWTIENNLGTRIQRLLVIAEDGRAFVATDCPETGSVTLSVADLRTELKKIKEQIDAARGKLPDGVPIEDLKAASMGRWGYYGNSGNVIDVSTRSGRLETSLVEATAIAPEGNGLPLEPVQPLHLGPRSYVAIVDRSPEAPTGVPAVREAGSLHVLVGRW